jgi:hypothetical protein
MFLTTPASADPDLNDNKHAVCHLFRNMFIFLMCFAFAAETAYLKGHALRTVERS